MIKFFITAEADLAVLSYNMTKFMNSVTRNGGLIISTHVVRDVNPLLTGVVFYSETKKERVATTLPKLTDPDTVKFEAGSGME